MSTKHHLQTLGLALLAALMLSACGSSSSESSTEQALKYTGNEEPAAIDASNAQTLATKSLGLGILGDTESDLDNLNKSVAPLSGSMVKEEENLADVIRNVKESIRLAFAPMYDEEDDDDLVVLSPELFFQYRTDENDTPVFFPSESAESTFSSDMTVSMPSETSLLFKGTLTCAEAVHCYSNAGDAYFCTDEYTVTGSMSFDELIINFEKPDLLPDDWAELSPFEQATYDATPLESDDWTAFQQLSYLLNETGAEVSKHQAATNGLFTLKTVNSDDAYGYYAQPSGYAVTRTVVYALNGEFTTEGSETPFNDQGLGTEEEKDSLLFTGDLDITMGLTNLDTRYSEDLVFAGKGITISLEGGWVEKRTPESVTAADVEMVASEDGSYAMELSGNASLTLNRKTPENTITVSASLENGKIVTEGSEKGAEKRVSFDASEDNFFYYPSTQLSESEDETESTTFSGGFTLDAVLTTFGVATQTKQLGLTLEEGTYTTTMTAKRGREYDPEKATPGNYYWYNEALLKQSTDINGKVTITNGEDPVALTGNITCTKNNELMINNDFPELNSDTMTGSITLNELGIKSAILDVAFQGTIDFDADFMNSESFNMKAELLVSNNVEAKTYWYNDYKISVPYRLIQDIQHDLAYDNYDEYYYEWTYYDDVEIAIEGRYYDPDFGYVDLSTGTTPFEIDGELLTRRSALETREQLFIFLFPTAGELTLTGAGQSQALLEVDSSVSKDADSKQESQDNSYTIPDGYRLSVDADGDGEFETDGRYDWPNLEETVENIWLFDLLLNHGEEIYQGLFVEDRGMYLPG